MFREVIGAHTLPSHQTAVIDALASPNSTPSPLKASQISMRQIYRPLKIKNLKMFEVFLTVLANVHIQQMMMMTDFTDHRDIPDFVLDSNKKHIVCECIYMSTFHSHKIP